MRGDSSAPDGINYSGRQILVFIILFLVWAGLVFYIGSAPFGEEGTGSWIEMFKGDAEKYDRMVNDQARLLAITRTVSYIGFYLFLYLAINGGSLKWSTGLAWLTLVLTGVALVWDEWRQSRREGRKLLRVNLMHCGLGAAYAHITLGILNAIF